jgi:hypothetical protein
VSAVVMGNGLRSEVNRSVPLLTVQQGTSSTAVFEPQRPSLYVTWAG